MVVYERVLHTHGGDDGQDRGDVGVAVAQDVTAVAMRLFNT